MTVPTTSTRGGAIGLVDAAGAAARAGDYATAVSHLLAAAGAFGAEGNREGARACRETARKWLAT